MKKILPLLLLCSTANASTLDVKKSQSDGSGWRAETSNQLISIPDSEQENAPQYSTWDCMGTDCESSESGKGKDCDLNPHCSDWPSLPPAPEPSFGWGGIVSGGSGGYYPPAGAAPVSGGGGGSNDPEKPPEACLLSSPSFRITPSPSPSPVYGGGGTSPTPIYGGGGRGDGAPYRPHSDDGPIDILRLPQSTQTNGSLELLGLSDEFTVQGKSDSCDIKNRQCYYTNMADLEECIGWQQKAYAKKLGGCKNGTYSGSAKVELGLSIASGIADVGFSWVEKDQACIDEHLNDFKGEEHLCRMAFNQGIAKDCFKK